MNSVQIIGRLTKDPELKYLTTGTAVARITVAVDRGLSKEKKEEAKSKGQPTADFINVVAWGRLAENLANFTRQGKRLAVQGRIQTGSYMAQDGTKRYTTEVFASNIEFIDWATDNQNTSRDSGTPFMDIDDIDPDDIPF